MRSGNSPFPGRKNTSPRNFPIIWISFTGADIALTSSALFLVFYEGITHPLRTVVGSVILHDLTENADRTPNEWCKLGKGLKWHVNYSLDSHLKYQENPITDN